MMILNSATALILVFLYMFGTGFVRWHKAWAHQRAATAVAMLSMFVPMGFWLYTMVAYGFKQGAMNVLLPLLERQLMDLSAVLPSNILVVFVVAAVPVFAAYALLEWQFKNSEVVGPVVKF